jgi:hypothetical protein
MIKSVQNIYDGKISVNGKQKNGFGAVNLNNYSPLTLENAFKQDFSRLFSDKPQHVIENFVKDVSARIHAKVQPVIDMFQGKKDKTLFLSISQLKTGDKYDDLHVIGASVYNPFKKIPEGPQLFYYLLEAENKFVPGMEKLNTL